MTCIEKIIIDIYDLVKYQTITTSVEGKAYYDINIQTILALLDEFGIIGNYRVEAIRIIKKIFHNVGL